MHGLTKEWRHSGLEELALLQSGHEDHQACGFAVILATTLFSQACVHLVGFLPSQNLVHICIMHQKIHVHTPEVHAHICCCGVGYLGNISACYWRALLVQWGLKWESCRNAEFQAPPQTCQVRMLCSKGFQGFGPAHCSSGVYNQLLPAEIRAGPLLHKIIWEQLGSVWEFQFCYLPPDPLRSCFPICEQNQQSCLLLSF